MEDRTFFMTILVDARMKRLGGKHDNFLAKNKLKVDWLCLPTKLAMVKNINC